MGKPWLLLIALAELAALVAWKEMGIAAAGNLLVFWLWAFAALLLVALFGADDPIERRPFFTALSRYVRIGGLIGLVAYGHVALPATFFILMIFHAGKRRHARDKAAQTKPQEVTHAE